MTKNKTRYLTIASLASVLASIGMAQVAEALNTTSNVAQNAATVSAQQAATASTHAASANASTVVNTAASNAAQTATSGARDAANAASTGATNNATSPANRPVSNNANVATDSRVNAATRLAPLTTSDQSAANRITASLNTAQTTAQIRSATGQNRDAIYAGVEANVATTSHALAELRRNSDRLRADARVKLTAAVNEARAREMELRQSLTAAREASAETASNANEELAANYQTYADAVADVEATAVASANSNGSTAR